MAPASGSWSVAMVRMSELLPAPLGPSRPNMPPPTVSETLWSARTPLGYVFERPVIVRATVPSSGSQGGRAVETATVGSDEQLGCPTLGLSYRIRPRYVSRLWKVEFFTIPGLGRQAWDRAEVRQGALSLRDRLQDAITRAEEIERELANPATVRDPRRLADLGREHSRLAPVMEMAARLKKTEDDLAQAHELLAVDDPEMAAEARAEEQRARQEIAALEAALKPALLPRDPLHDRPAIVEIRAGTGGDEAALFAADLYRMYTRYCERQGWRVEPITHSDGTLGGIKEVIFK